MRMKVPLCLALCAALLLALCSVAAVALQQDPRSLQPATPLTQPRSGSGSASASDPRAVDPEARPFASADEELESIAKKLGVTLLPKPIGKSRAPKGTVKAPSSSLSSRTATKKRAPSVATVAKPKSTATAAPAKKTSATRPAPASPRSNQATATATAKATPRPAGKVSAKPSIGKKAVAPKPAGRKASPGANAKPRPTPIKALLQTRAHTRAQSEAEADTAARADFPDGPLTDANDAREFFRNGFDAEDIADRYALKADAPGKGRVESATFTVLSCNRGSFGVGPKRWTAMQFNPNPARAGQFYVKGEAGSLVKSLYHVGHIQASTLGGSDWDPLNFMPLHFQSNSNGGRWYRAELIAGSLNLHLRQLAGNRGVLATSKGQVTRMSKNPDAEKKQLAFWTRRRDLHQWLIDRGADDFRTNACPVTVRITMSYDDAANPWLAIGGTYKISMSADCHALLHSMSGSDLLDPYVQAFVKHAQLEGPLLARTAFIRTEWLNAPDMALADDLPHGAVLAPEYKVAKNLFP